MERLLNWTLYFKLFNHIDEELAEQTRVAGCQNPACPGVLHRSDYERKPRGIGVVEQIDFRSSFCCNQEGCRKRHTPPSVIFLGRRVYVGVTVILLTAMLNGVNERRARELGEKLGVDKKTLTRWRTWWLEQFPQSQFWKEAKGRFCEQPQEGFLPLSLLENFGVPEDSGGVLLLLKFLSPISIGPLKLVKYKETK